MLRQKKHPEHTIHGTGSLPQYEFDGDDYDRYYLPARGAMRMIADLSDPRIRSSHLITPGQSLNTTVDFLKTIFQPTLQNKPHSIFATPDHEYLLWNEVAKHMPEFLNWLKNNNLMHTLIGLSPYASAPDYWTVVDQLRSHGLNIHSTMDRFSPQETVQPNNFLHKGAYYPWMNGTQTEKDVKKFSKIPMPRGLVATTPQETLDALQKLFAQKNDIPVVLKQIFAGGGYGIEMFPSISEAHNAIVSGKYHFEPHPYDPNQLHPVLIQEAINIQHDTWGEVGISVQFMGTEILEVTRTLADGKHWTGNILLNPENSAQAGVRRAQLQNARKIAQQMLNILRPQGKGGIDLLVTTDNAVQFIELNGGRTTGAEEALQLRRITRLSRSNGSVGVHKYSLPAENQFQITDIANQLAQNNMLFGFNRQGIAQPGLLPLACFGDHLTLLGYAETPNSLLNMFSAIQGGSR